MRRRILVCGLAALAAGLGIAAIPAASDSAASKATLIVHVYSTVGSEVLPGEPSLVPDEYARVRITKLGHHGELLSSRRTMDRTLHVYPGLYEIALAVHTTYRGRRRVTLHAGQTREVTLTVVTH